MEYQSPYNYNLQHSIFHGGEDERPNVIITPQSLQQQSFPAHPIQAHVIERPPTPVPKKKRIYKPRPNRKRYPRKPQSKPPKEYPSSVQRREERKHKNHLKLRAEHQLKPACNGCRRNCTAKFTEEHRQRLNDEFWSLDFTGRRQFAKNHISCGPIDRRTGRTERRLYSFNYFLKNENFELIKVCRMFFLTTLGYAKNNSTLISSTSFDIAEEDVDGRGRYSRKNQTQTTDTTQGNDESVSAVDSIIDSSGPLDVKAERPKYIKGGEAKWKIREQHRLQLLEQEEERIRIIKSRHPQVRRCVATCTSKCIRRISKARCIEIHDKYWRMTTKEKTEFRQQNVFLRKIPDRIRRSDPVRKKTIRNVCSFTKETGDRVYVCQWFFLSTLGYQTSMSSILNKTPNLTYISDEVNTVQNDDDLLSETEVAEDEHDKKMVDYYRTKAQEKNQKYSKRNRTDDYESTPDTTSDDDDDDDDSMDFEGSMNGGDDDDDEDLVKQESMDEEYLDELDGLTEMVVKVEPETVKIEIEMANVGEFDENDDEMGVIDEPSIAEPEANEHFETVSIIEPKYVVKPEQDNVDTSFEEPLSNPLAERTRSKYLVDSESIKPMRPPCNIKCRRHCRQNFPEAHRVRIHEEYWSLDVRGRFNFINKFTIQTTPKQRTTVEVIKERQFSVNYYLKAADQRVIKVCREFFLATLGYKKTSTGVLDNVLKESRRRRFESSMDDEQCMVDRVCEHCELYKPLTLEEGSSKRYFPSDINCRLLFDTYMTAHPNMKCSVEDFRKILLQSDYCFSRDNGENCEQCLNVSMHAKQCQGTCQTCDQHVKHRQRIEECQKFYEADMRKTNDERRIIAQVNFSLHMLPRIECKKEIMKAHRLATSCLSFSHLSIAASAQRPFVVVWNETIGGFESDDIMSAFYAFFLHYRDAREIILWIDGSLTQTKSWSFFNFIVKMVRCEEISAKTIIIKYFECGHTIDSLYHINTQIDESINQKKNIYDFTDLCFVSQTANSGQAIVKIMYPQDFRNWIDDINPETFQGGRFPVLSDIAVIKIYKTKFEMYQYYSKEYSLANLCVLDFIKGKFLDNSMKNDQSSFDKPDISDELKESIKNTLLPLIPTANRQQFWKNLM